MTTATMWDQLELFPDVTLAPTIAIERGESFVFQCDQCGTLLCIPSSSTRSTLLRQVKRELGTCPRCDRPKWTHVDLNVGPFRRSYPSVSAHDRDAST